MAKVINLIGQTMGGNDKRSKITKIARHHSATETGDVFTFERHWKNARGWNTGGYHEVILRNGDVQLCYAPETVSNGVYGHNQTTYHICLVGNGSFTDEQEKAFDERVRYNLERFNLNVDDVLGHNEFSGSSTECPGIDMGRIRTRLKGGTSKKSSNKANLTVDGKWGNNTTESLQQSLGTPVDGIISNQRRNSVSQSLYGTTVKFSNNGNSNVIVALQKKVGAKADGLIGPATVRSLQSYLGTVVDGVLSRPSMVVKEMQRRLNKGTF